jgi:tryptophan synthase alpha chain
LKDVTQDRLAEKFRRIEAEGGTGLILFLTAGFPDMDATLELVPALAQAGADCIELGVPFSDPLADGPIIQASSFHALKNEVTLDSCIRLVSKLRSRVPDTPLILMGYYNPILSYGLPRFAQEAHLAGVDGVIVADLPPDESGPLMEECRPLGIHVIPLLAPTSTDLRIEKACRTASGFVYCVSLTGVTGARDEIPPGVSRFVERVRMCTRLPLAVGFGISRREHVDSIGKHAQAAVVGSALIKVIMDSPRDEMIDRARQYVLELSGATPSIQGERGRGEPGKGESRR